MTDNARRRFRLLTLLATCTLLLWGCGGTPTREEETPVPEPEPEVPEAVILDPFTLPASDFSGVFSLAEAHLARFDWMQASVALQQLPDDGLSSDDLDYRRYLEARIAFIRGDQPGATMLLAGLERPGSDPALRYRALSFKHHMLSLSNRHLAAARSASAISTLVPPEHSQGWERHLWRHLARAAEADLQAARTQAINPQWQAWLELALISREQGAVRSNEVLRWQADNPDHPAANPLPGGLGQLFSPLPAPGKIALLLPLSGRLAPAGQAVLDGYLAAHYKDAQSLTPGVEILVIDTASYPATTDAYEEALLRGADFVVGPLHKEGVADLLTYPARPVPVLALNRVSASEAALSGTTASTPVSPSDGYASTNPAIPVASSALVQASLSPEDEARQLAELAFGEGSRSAVIVRPAGDWGVKIEKALSERWRELGGKVADIAVFSTQESYSDSLTDALGLSAGRQRARMVRDMLAENVEFTPRRRQDIDAIFLLTRNGAQARAIKPLLAFHYAGTLPVYATSTIYNGIADPGNRDLNGTRLLATPWLLGANPELRVAIAAGDRDSGAYTLLNALGADAHLLQSEFSRLQSGPDALLRGSTGLLSMNPELQILRETRPATFDRGELTPR